MLLAFFAVFTLGPFAPGLPLLVQAERLSSTIYNSGALLRPLLALGLRFLAVGMISVILLLARFCVEAGIRSGGAEFRLVACHRSAVALGLVGVAIIARPGAAEVPLFGVALAIGGAFMILSRPGDEPEQQFAISADLLMINGNEAAAPMSARLLSHSSTCRIAMGRMDSSNIASRMEELGIARPVGRPTDYSAGCSMVPTGRRCSRIAATAICRQDAAT